jgi:hypothetical protein
LALITASPYPPLQPVQHQSDPTALQLAALVQQRSRIGSTINGEFISSQGSDGEHLLPLHWRKKSPYIFGIKISCTRQQDAVLLI